MKSVLLAGGSGLIGTALKQYLSTKGYEVSILTRNKTLSNSQGYILWEPKKAFIDPKALKYPIVVNLAGANVSQGRWIKSRKEVLYNSRISTTEFLFQSLKSSDIKVYIGASAIGFYGDRYAEPVDEQSENGDDFLAKLTLDWEEAHKSFYSLTPNVKIARIGIVLSHSDGALPKMALPFKFGVGAYFGSGKQYYSWIHIEDICRAFQFMIEHKNEQSIFNLVSPNPVTAKDFNISIRAAKNQFAVVHSIPTSIVRSIFGEQASILLNSTKVQPAQLLMGEFDFKHPDLTEALKNLWSN